MSNQWTTVTAEWQGNFAFTGTNSSGGSVQIGELDHKPGVGPMEMLLLGVAGCTGIDIVSILTKKRISLDKFLVQVRGLRADEHPKVYKNIEVEYHLWGDDIVPSAVEQAIQLSEDKYCSASVMLKSVAEIKSKYVIHKSGG